MINKATLKSGSRYGIREKDIYSSYKIFLGTLVSEPRLKIINLLRKGEKSVSEISEKLNFDQTAVSHNLARLKKCGFVSSSSEGKFRHYRLNEKTIKPLMEIIDKHMMRYCIHILKEMDGGKNE